MAYTYGTVTYCSTYNNTASKKYEARLGWEYVGTTTGTSSGTTAALPTSTFTIILQVRSNNTSYYTYGNQTTTINGVKLATAKFNTGSGSTTWKTFGTTTVSVAHNADGTFPATTISGSFTTNVAETYCLTSGSASVTIATDAVEPALMPSTFTLSGSALGSAVSVAITRQNTSFTHKVEYSFAGSAYTTATSNATTSASFTPALSLATNIPNATSGVLTVRVTTFNGTTQVGSPTIQTLTLSLPTSVVPTFTSVTAAHNSSNTTVKGWGLYVKGYSTATLTINGAAGAQGSTITSYSISGGGFSSSSSSFTTGILNTSGSITFTATITDSRGRTASKTTSITVYDYFTPSISVNAFRCNSSGTATDAGTYLRVTATYNYATVNSKNTISRSVSCNSVSNTTFTSGTAFTLAANAAVASNYTLTATISDALGGSATATASIPNTAALPLHIKGNKKGIGLGTTAATDNTVEIGWTVDLNNNNVTGGNTITATTFSGALSGNATSSSSCSGNAATATKLATARTIRTNLASTSTASFDGSGNITPGVTGTLPLGNGGTGATTAAAALTNFGLTATAAELNYCDGVTSNIQTQLNGKSPLGCQTGNESMVLLWSGSSKAPSFTIADRNIYKYYLVVVGTADTAHGTWIFVPHSPSDLATFFRGIGGYEGDGTATNIYSLTGTVSGTTVTISEVWQRSSYNNWSGTAGTQRYVRRVYGVK